MSGEALRGITRENAPAMVRSGAAAALESLVRAFRKMNEETRNFANALSQDEVVQNIRTGMEEEGQAMTWEQFCVRHSMSGDRFKQFLEPLMELRTGAIIDEQIVSLREFCGDDIVMKVFYKSWKLPFPGEKKPAAN